MGVNVLRRNSASRLTTQSNQPPNPDPLNYRIIRSEQIGRFLLVKIKYLDCINFEGEKILLYEGITIDNLLKQRYIDPHFSDSKEHLHPIARFIPTDAGWNLANTFAWFNTKIQG